MRPFLLGFFVLTHPTVHATVGKVNEQILALDVFENYADNTHENADALTAITSLPGKRLYRPSRGLGLT
jgi:hypothetical protein